MKTRFLLLLLLVAAVAFAVGNTTSGKRAKLSSQTQQNLSTAMHGEAFAFVKYSLYADQARHNGKPDLANLFDEAAKTERFDHFEREARLAGLIGSDAENLKNAIQGESYEVETMYLDFEKEAAAAGDVVTADRFQEIRRDEVKHRDAFKAALTKLQGQTAQKR